MKALLVLALFAAFVVAPALAFSPHADACQPYSYYCFLNGRYYYGCGTQVPGPAVSCIRDAAV